jgi:membrane fusion protein (multidrug efflux system)
MTAKKKAAQADLKALEQQLEFYSLRAPIAGKLGMVQVVPGQTLNPGAFVADVVNLQHIDALCYAPTQVAARLALAQKAKLFVEGATDAKALQHLMGEVVFISIQADPQTGNVAVKARFPNPSLRVRANAVVRVFVLTRPEKEYLAIPDSALMEDQEPAVVATVAKLVTKKNEEEEYQVGEIRKLNAKVELRDRDRHLVVVHLEDPVTKESINPAGLLFVTEGSNGLENGDAVRLRK